MVRIEKVSILYFVEIACFAAASFIIWLQGEFRIQI